MELRAALVLTILSCVKSEGLSTLSSNDVNKEYETSSPVGCYFSAELQGEFVMQVSGRGARGSVNIAQPIRYSTVNITFNAIPVWGYCHKRINDNVLLIDSYDDGQCIRCFKIIQRSRNVIEVFSQDLNRCYTDESIALASCDRLYSSSILYRTKEIGLPIRNEYCPISGQYKFKYNINDGVEERSECSTFSSSLSNCPDGSVMKLKFNRCSFDDHEISFNCLGSWTDHKGRRYIALLDTREDGQRSPYRCGMFHVDSRKGKTYLAFGNDSSCTENLYNATSGLETLILTKNTNTKQMPNYVKTHLSEFPKWSQGEWQETLIINGTMTFTDLNGYNSYTFVSVDSNHDTGRYIVYSKDQCEREAYVCVMMKQRSENVLEFTTGVVSSTEYQPYLCDDSNLDKPVWMTQARLERVVESPCPITGEYMGEITDLPGMCAELSSNCNTREIMYYKVSDCKTKELYEERTYLCLGQWEENGVMYTYTTRNDTGTNECFVGLIVNDEEIYIKEAGEHCLRDIDPRTVGMRLYKKGQCYGNSPSPAPTPRSVPYVPIMRITTPRQRYPAGVSKTTPRVVASSAVRLGFDGTAGFVRTQKLIGPILLIIGVYILW